MPAQRLAKVAKLRASIAPLDDQQTLPGTCNIHKERQAVRLELGDGDGLHLTFDNYVDQFEDGAKRPPA